MPYSSMKDVNPSLKGIKPPITLAQANVIAAMADAMAASDNPPDSPWAVAIANFKKAYKVVNGKWVKKEAQAESEPTRKLGNREFVLSDFLVYGEKDKPETWNLPVRFEDKPDKKMMERVWLALHEGYNGKAYDGPLKELAIKRLTKLYQETGYDVPEPSTVVAEFGDDSLEGIAQYVKDAFNGKRQSGDNGYMFALEVYQNNGKLGDAVIVCSQPENKYYAAPYTFTGNTPTFDDKENWKEVYRTWDFVTNEPMEGAESEFDEVVGGHAVSIEETDIGDLTPMKLDAILIKPGWGNKHDMNYYSEQMLRESAEVFVDAKMFEKDHTPDKNNRDWVSTVERIKGVSGEGILAEVIVHDDDFAKRARALQKAGKLHLLECSIQAGGTAREGKVNGVKGKIVEKITEARAVDWVTKAGAGGHAVALGD